jgi:CubicO group peptidase (beta-lactamase class C family)
VVQRPRQPQLAGRRLIRRRSAAGALLAAAFAALLFGPCATAQTFPGKDWEHVSPAQSGWSEDGLAGVKAAAQQINFTAVMVVHHGRIVAEWGDTAARTELASVRKSLLSAMIGIAVAERKISLDSTLGQLGIDDNPPALTATEKKATVRMLLQARSGVYHPALYETAAMAKARPLRGSHAPGTFWYYNNWDFNVLGTIYEHATGTGIYDALDRLIARPVGMQDYRPQDGTYFPGPDSIHRAYPLRMSARDLARFALLYLHGGNWAGRQVVPTNWVQESTQPYSDASSRTVGRGYGYLWWTAPPSPEPGGMPKGSFTALGAGGQYAFVVPTADLVLVARVDRDKHLPEPRFSDFLNMLHLALKAGGLDDK